MKNVGKTPLSVEDLENYRSKEKDRELIIEKNKKVKKKHLEEAVPVLEPIEENSDGSIFINKIFNNFTYKYFFLDINNEIYIFFF